MRDVLVIVDTAQGDGERFLEALRMAVGLSLAKNRVRLHFLREAVGALANCDPVGEAGKQLDALRELGVERIVEGSADEAMRATEVVLRWGR